MLHFFDSNSPKAITFIIALFVLVLLPGCSSPEQTSEGVRLLVAGEILEPSSLLDLRFEEPVVDDQQVGLAADPSPITIRPHWPGTFRWISRRSGVFTPSEPPKLGYEYWVTLRSDLRRADGTRVAAKLARRLRAPDFGVEEYTPVAWSTNNVSSEPRLDVRFNANLNLDSVQGHVHFRDANGRRAEADVRMAKRSNSSNEPLPYLSSQTWEERFYQAHANSEEHSPKLPERNIPASDIIAHHLVITPVHPLPVGTNWQLVIGAGLPAANGQWHLREPFYVRLGNILPFQVTEVRPINHLNSGKRLQITFSKSLGPEIDNTNVTTWIQIMPFPPALEWTTEADRVEVKADFQPNQDYTVTVRSGLPGMSGFRLEESYETRTRFSPIPSRLYFPSFSSDQLSGGTRKIELLSINMTDVRLRAKLLDRATLVHALRGYRGYHKNNYDWEEPYQEVDFNLMAGKTIFQTNLVLAAPLDLPVNTVLSWDEILKGRRHGAVFLTAERNPGKDWGSREVDLPRSGLGTQTLIQLTDLGLYWKRSHKRLWTLVFSYEKGNPIQGAILRLLNNDGDILQEVETGPDVLAEMDLPDEAVWLMAEKEADLHVVRIASKWDNQLPVNPGIHRDWEEGTARSPALLLFSDRPVYRPGETVHLKAVLREWRNDRLDIPLESAAQLTCFDGRERQFYQTNLNLTDLGTTSASIPLPDSGLGAYRAELWVGTNICQTHYFQVQQFKPSAFEVEVKAETAFSAEAKVRYPIHAQYYMGKPVGKARLQWSLRIEDAGFQPEGYEDFSFCTQVESRLGRDAASFLLTGETNGSLPLVLEPDIPANPVAPQPRTLDLEVEVTDFSHQTLSTRYNAIRHSSEFYLGMKRFQNVLRADDPISLHLIAVQPDGKPWSEPVKAKLRWHKIEWRTVRLQSAGSAASYRSDPETILLSEQEVLIQEDSSETHNSGLEKAIATLKPESGGLYLLEAMARDSQGREVITAVTFHVASQEEIAWNYRNPVQIEMEPDQTQYQAGQTATLLVKTPINGWAIVTIERDRLIRQFTTRLSGNAPTIQVPLLPEDAPNVFVSLFILRSMADSPRQIKQPDYRMGYCQLQVRWPEKELVLDIESDQPDYRPGQPVSVRTRVRDGVGQAVANAEVTLFAVDEGGLSLREYERPDPLSYFWAPRRLGIWTHSSLPSLLPEDSDELRFQNKGFLVGGGGTDSYGRLRKNFQACAFWNATLRTDTNGWVTACFTAPDSMTRYRLMAIALTVDQFGNGESSFVLNKPLMIEPALPRFANEGDHLMARAVVHTSGQPSGPIELSLTLNETAQGEKTGSKTLTHQVTTDSQGTTVVDFPVELVSAGTAQWIWRARTLSGNEFSDSVQSSFSVGYGRPLLREVSARRIQGETNLLNQISPQLLEGQGTIRVSVANTRMAELNEAASHLLHYPYGCAEQTASSLIPWIVLRSFKSVIPALDKDPEAITKVVGAGVERLLSMQTSGGGLAYWPGGSEAMLWATAYGGLALVIAKENGYSVPQENLERLLVYLSSELKKTSEWWDNADISNGTLALYTLARAHQPLVSLYEELFAKRERLWMENRTLLALAILAGQGPRDMAEELLKPQKLSPSQENLWFGGPQRELAIQLLAWLHLRPDDRMVDPLILELLQARQNGHWTTTQGNAWALMALGEYIHRVESEISPAKGILQWGQEQREFRFASEPKALEFVFTNSSENLNLPMLLRTEDSKMLYSVTTVEAYPRINPSLPEDHGFTLRREYALMDEEGRVVDFHHARVGDCVLVTLRLEARQPARYLAIEDPWPALLEGINSEFKSQNTRREEKLSSSWVSDYKELRNDRALFFKDFLPPGRYTIQYLARVRAAGEAIAPGAKVEEMYSPARFGLSESLMMTINN